MSNIAPKQVPTLRDSKDPQELDVFQREVRELIRRLREEIESLKARVTALE